MDVDTKSPATCASDAIARKNHDTLGFLYGALTPKVVRFGCIEAHSLGNLSGAGALLAHIAGLSGMKLSSQCPHMELLRSVKITREGP